MLFIWFFISCSWISVFVLERTSTSEVRVRPLTGSRALSLSTTATTSWRWDYKGNRCLMGTESLSQLHHSAHSLCSPLQYLSSCLSLCPRAYSDDELLLLLTVVGRVGLDTRLILQSSVELYPLQYKIINNIRDWNTMVSSCMTWLHWKWWNLHFPGLGNFWQHIKLYNHIQTLSMRAYDVFLSCF